MPKEMKKYKLKRGFHRFANPDFDPDAKGKEARENPQSHYVAKTGDMVPLSDEQFASFSDKFEPAESEASETRDKEKAKMDKAIKDAEENEESADTTIVRPIDSPSTLERHYQGTEAGRAGQTPAIISSERDAREQALRGGVAPPEGEGEEQASGQPRTPQEAVKQKA